MDDSRAGIWMCDDFARMLSFVYGKLFRSNEDEWLGGPLSFGEEDDAPAITVTMRDERCSMINLDPVFRRLYCILFRYIYYLTEANGRGL